jgi:predicted nucleic acid-binding protein
VLRNTIDDAQLAAIAISRGATLASFDSHFAVFVEHGLRWERLAAA